MLRAPAHPSLRPGGKYSPLGWHGKLTPLPTRQLLQVPLKVNKVTSTKTQIPYEFYV